MNRARGVPILALAGAMVLGSCVGSSAEPAAPPGSIDQSSSGAPASNDLFAEFTPDLQALGATSAPLIDETTGLPQFPTAMADQVRALAGGDAGLLSAADDIEASERLALDGLIAALVSGTAVDGIGPIDGTDTAQDQPAASGTATSVPTGPTTPASEPQGFGSRRPKLAAQSAQSTAQTFSTSGVITGYMTSLTSGVRPPAGATVGGQSPTLAVSAETTAGVVMKRVPDGQVTFGFNVDVEVDKPAADGNAAVKGSAGVVFEVTADPCPAADGTVKLTFRAKLGADIAAGSKSAIGSNEVSGTVVAQVDDTATVSSFDIDARQQSTGTNSAGVGTFVDTSAAYRLTLSTKVTAELSPPRRNRESQDVDFGERNRLHEDGMLKAIRFARGALEGLERAWKDGKCVSVVATGGGKVSPGAVTPIQVSVSHKRDGDALALPVDATLSGSQSIDPTRIAAAPGTVTHTASDASKSVATIEFVSTSRRGIGRATVTITAGADSYVASGGGSGGVVSGTVADVAAPFTLEVSFAGGSAVLSFAPTDEHGGTYSYEGSLVSGGGSYTIAGDEGGPLTLNYSGNGCAIGGQCAATSAVVTLTPNE